MFRGTRVPFARCSRICGTAPRLTSSWSRFRGSERHQLFGVLDHEREALTESFLSGNPSAPSVIGLGGFERETGGVMFTGQSVAERCDTGDKENGHRAAGALLLVGARGTVAQARMPETRWPTRSTRSRASTKRCDAS